MAGHLFGERRSVGAVNVGLLFVFLGYLHLLTNRALEIGSRRGGWVYPYISELEVAPLALFLLSAPLVGVLLHISFRQVERHPWPLLAAWLAAGLALHLLIRSTYPLPLAHLVRSDVCNSFYSVSLRHSPGHLLRNWTVLADRLPLHAHTNLPGKILLYHLLELVTSAPAALGVMLIVVSNMGAVLIFFITRKLLREPATALLAAVFYLLVPAKVGFFPILNTVSPVFILGAFLVFLAWLDRPGWFLAALLGVALYLAILFEPMPLVLGLVFAAFLLRHLLLGALAVPALARLLIAAPAAFLTLHTALVLGLGFDLLDAFRHAVGVTMAFYGAGHRPYDLWLVGNLKEFLPGNGVLATLLLLVLLADVGRQVLRALRVVDARPRAVAAVLLAPPHLLGLVLLGCMGFLDLFGGSRGETARWWIFLAAFLQIPAADVCVRLLGRSTAWLATFATLLQTFVTTSMVGWLLC